MLIQKLYFLQSSIFVNQHLAAKPTATLNEAVQRLKNDSRFKRLQVDLEDVIRPFKKGESFSMPNLYKQILSQYAAQHQVEIIGDKAPKYVEYLPVLHNIFPNAKIIHLIRDPRDVYLSRNES